MIVFDIKRYAINDGPGIRTTVFFKGCPLRCVWCHNPESWLPKPELLFKQKKCIACNTCGLFPDQLGKPMAELLQTYAPASLADKAEACPAMALEMAGRDYSLELLMQELEKERDIMQDSEGGVTVSGGEPLMQPAALCALLDECGRRGFHRAVDTTLYAPPQVVEEVAARTDLFLVDLKLMDPERHKAFTGVSNDIILDNLRRLHSKQIPIIIRIPLIEGVNADEQNIEATALFLEDLTLNPNPLTSPTGGQQGANSHPIPLNLLPYHDLGKDKHRRRRTTYNPSGLPLAVPSDATLQRCIRQFAAHGIAATIGG